MSGTALMASSVVAIKLISSGNGWSFIVKGQPKICPRSEAVETIKLFFDIHTGPYRNACRYLAALNDYRQRSAVLPS
ncbi:hypothetical protein EVAR_97085_1 [Eumeta japonica]|uniref:Uncharacterized protein n=1 Tax=Eumeta variegata TaxID=151549 RepID=A0A4C1X721_EUMVA|nr:hypothetical protein EVAR_97085_1 [Eumeta japonica]